MVHLHTNVELNDDQKIGVDNEIQSLSAYGKLQVCIQSSTRVEGGGNYQLPHIRKKYIRTVSRLEHEVTCNYIVLNVAVNTAKEFYYC